MDYFRTAAAAVTGLLGLCFVIGFFRAFRDRLYLGLLGLSFMSLAANMLVSAPELGRVKLALWVVTGLLFVGACCLAVAQTLAQMRLIREHRKGLEAEMWAYLEQLQQRNAEQGKTADAAEPPADSTPGGEG